ncbi:tryptophanase [Candidatus Woesearchaeota archaeon]|nr:MAG: tryptophanase [Candidatus Woesearchaeota archaeon]
MNFFELVSKFKDEKALSRPRPYTNHSVSFKKQHTAEERTKMLEKVGLNVFNYPANMITGCDFLSDSGTTTMTDEQWASLSLGDESYGSNKGYFLLAKQIRETFGEDWEYDPINEKPSFYLFHQGRPAEYALFKAISTLGRGLIIPSNGHFDTTEANIESNNIEPMNLFSEELVDGMEADFKGNMNIEELRELLKEQSKNVPLIYLTITNNTGGGQPVSMENIKEVSELAKQYKVPFFFDACRFAENAWFIQQKESGYNKKEIIEIIHEMFSYVDGFHISFKKDGLVNMGGGLFIKKNGLFARKYPHLLEFLTDHQILTEGHPTYGGISGRDLMTLVYGLRTVIKQEYLDHRIQQVQQFGQMFIDAGIPVVTPIGGHAVYLDINKFFHGTNMKGEDFGGISFVALLLAGYGHRAVELGYFAFGKFEDGHEKHPRVNYVRFAVPRLKYEEQDLRAVVEAVKALHDHKDKIPGVEVEYGRELTLRHFKAKFAFKR